MSTPSDQNSVSDAAAPTRGGKTISFHLNVALVLALIALMLIGWEWLDTRQRMRRMEYDLARRVAEMSGVNKESNAIALQSRQDTRNLAQQLNLLDQRVTQSQNQQIALEAMYQEFSRNREDWTLAEIEQILTIASQQLILAGDVKAALIALQAADSRLQQMDKPQWYGVRKAMNADMERLRALPYVDVTGVSFKIDALIQRVDTLPVLPGAPSRPQRAHREQQTEGGWRNLFSEAWNDLKQMVRIRDMGKREVPLLSPTQTFFLRENLKLRLLTARIALMQRDQASFKADIDAASSWLAEYFDTRDPAVMAAQATLKQLGQLAVTVDVGDLSLSLNAVRNSINKVKTSR